MNKTFYHATHYAVHKVIQITNNNAFTKVPIMKQTDRRLKFQKFRNPGIKFYLISKFHAYFVG